MACATSSIRACAERAEMALLEIRDFSLAISNSPILKNIGLDLDEGEIMGLVGESGSGKSMTALSIMQLLPTGSARTGSIRFDGAEMTKMSEGELCQLRGDDIGMVFQEPMTALNPVKTIGEQVAEGIRLHARVSSSEANERTRQMLERVGLPHDRFPLSRYPHELSGGQRQRVGIAMACAMRPKLLIADEPTTALDVTIQAQILALLRDLVNSNGMALLLISHDLGVVADTADRISIMRRGQILDSGGTVEVLTQLRHPYTANLAAASSHIPERHVAPVLSREASRQGRDPLLDVTNLICEYRGRGLRLFGKRQAAVRAVDSVSFEIYPGQTVALVGESGCGKSTLARTLLGLQDPTSGRIEFAGRELVPGDPGASNDARRGMQIVFQDPYGSFNPRHRVERLLAEPLFADISLSRAQKRDRVLEAIEAVQLSRADLAKYVHEFSGGQRQRLAIARALVGHPTLIIADEPVSALDVSIRAQILDLLSSLRDRLGVAYLFISHDLTVVRALCDEVIVMLAGKFLEHGPVEQVFQTPQHGYTRQLLEAAPNLAGALARRRALIDRNVE
jgi:peptide/nickel transport system ATP-binding protein